MAEAQAKLQALSEDYQKLQQGKTFILWPTQAATLWEQQLLTRYDRTSGSRCLEAEASSAED